MKPSPSIVIDGLSTFPGMEFGPMGPAVRAAAEGAEPGTSLQQKQPQTTTDLPTAVTEKKERTYVIAAFEFHRVETPFLIGLWIFFASLAKIGNRLILYPFFNIPYHSSFTFWVKDEWYNVR